MYHRYVALIIFACTFATLSPLRTYAASLPAVVLSEIQWGGSALSTADEWIELANVSSEPVDISSWKITGIASQGAEIVIPTGTVLPSKATYLVANYALGDVKTALAVSPNLVSSSVSISNSSLTVTLVATSGTIIDSYSDQETPGTGSSSPHASAERDLESGSWFTATSSQNLLAGETMGSPGYATFPAIAPVLAEVPIPTEQAILLDAEIQEETLLSQETSETLDETSIVEEIVSLDLPEESTIPELSSSEIIAEIDPSTPEEVIVPVEEGTEVEVMIDGSLETDDLIESENVNIEVVTLIAPITTELVVSAVEDASHDMETLDPSVPPSQSSGGTGRRDDEPAQPDDESMEQDDEPEIITITKTLDYSALRVTEFLSSPSEGSEWIEIWNSGTEKITLDGIGVTDASKKVTALSGVLDAGDYFLVENPKGKLNNTDDIITLTLSDGQILFTLTYGTKSFPAPKKGSSAGLCSDGWRTDLVPSPTAKNSCPTTITTLKSPTYDTQISTPSTLELSSSASGTSPTLQRDVPVTENTGSADTPSAQVTTSIVTEAIADSAKEMPSASSEKPSSSSKKKSPASEKKTSSKSLAVSVELHDLEKLPSGQRVEVTGIVVAEPGMFGKRIAYLDGAQLYFHKATWPSLPLGSLVSLTGTWDYDGDSRRIKISNASDIEILGSESIEPTSWDNVSSETPGDILITASGTLVKKEGDVFIFSSLTGKDFRVVDEAKTGSLNILRAGDDITVTGMLFPSDGNWVIAPRNAHDVSLAVPDASEQEPPSSSASATILTTVPPTNPTPIVGGGILVSSVSALGYWFFRTKKLSLLFS